MNKTPEQERFTLIPSVYLIFRRDNEILLLRRANTGYMDGFYNLVAGHLEQNEQAKVGAAREAVEETGVVVDPDKLRLVHIGHRYNRGRIDFFFEATEWQGEVVNKEPGLCDDLSWHSLNSLPDRKSVV